MLPEKYEKLSDQELDAVNVKIQCTADEIGIEQKCSEVKLTHTIFLVNERQRWVEDMEELLAVNFYSPVDLNYPNWHHWTGNNLKMKNIPGTIGAIMQLLKIRFR